MHERKVQKELEKQRRWRAAQLRASHCLQAKSNEQEKIPTGKSLILQNNEHNVKRKTNTDFDRNVHVV